MRHAVRPATFGARDEIIQKFSVLKYMQGEQNITLHERFSEAFSLESLEVCFTCDPETREAMRRQ